MILLIILFNSLLIQKLFISIHNPILQYVINFIDLEPSEKAICSLKYLNKYRNDIEPISSCQCCENNIPNNENQINNKEAHQASRSSLTYCLSKEMNPDCVYDYSNGNKDHYYSNQNLSGRTCSIGARIISSLARKIII